MTFNKYFDIEIKHAYFKESICNDLLIQPTTQCSRLLKNHKLLFKNTDANKISVYAAVDDKEELLLNPPQGSLFEFYIFLAKPAFLNYSKLPEKDAGEVYLFASTSNDSSNEVLPVTIVKRSINNGFARPLFGIIQITPANRFPATYTIEFEAAEAKWKYYLLADNNLKNLTINGALAGIDFGKISKADGDKKDKIRNALNSNFPDANLLIFESKEKVPFYKNGRKDIRLMNADKNIILINDLPNPSFRDNGIKIINIIN